MLKSKQIIVQGSQISIISHNGDGDFISLTDMAKSKTYDSGVVISNWLTTKYTIQFIGLWEQLHNPEFNLMEFHKIKNEVGTNGFIVSSSMWIKQTKAIGIRSSAGRYGGTFAHKDIAFEFATWLSPEFKLYLIKEFQRLKTEESERLRLGWDVKRTLVKINYKIHTDAIKEHLIPPHISKESRDVLYASEADVLNVALFGNTAKDWRDKNPNKNGNIRDYADITQLVVLANLEGINAEFIRRRLPQSERLIRLNEIAIIQMRSLIGNASIKKFK
ncbi:MAG TPA: KilA-N domain-containing protein [Candidatus Limnocylindria bacterium]|nr:KilA-N domain-containing protein [Candidatus Limnocylindria bacterium]